MVGMKKRLDREEKPLKFFHHTDNQTFFYEQICPVLTLPIRC